MNTRKKDMHKRCIDNPKKTNHQTSKAATPEFPDSLSLLESLTLSLLESLPSPVCDGRPRVHLAALDTLPPRSRSLGGNLSLLPQLRLLRLHLTHLVRCVSCGGFQLQSL